MATEGEDIILYHKGLGATAAVKTERQAEIYAESGWTKATKAQQEEHASQGSAPAAAAEGGDK